MHQSEINATEIIEPGVTKTRWFNQITDTTLRDLIKETYSCINADNHILATIGSRAALERTMILLGASQNTRGFTTKLKQLEKNNVIEKKERELLQWLIDQGNLATHKGYGPTLSELTKITMLVQAFIRRTNYKYPSKKQFR